jgi:RNA polymerase sigma-70 factor (sigma-E family)
MSHVATPMSGPEALEELYRCHATSLLRLAVLLVGDRAAAEDIVQETFARYFRSRSAPIPGKELAYLRRTVVNLCSDRGRRTAMALRMGTAAEASSPASDTIAAANLARRRVVAAVQALPARQRACVVLHYFSGLTDTDIAEALGISRGSVKTHLHRAREALRVELEDLA